MIYYLMSSILFLLSFNQSVLWGMKDSLVVTSFGAEVIPFIKLWAIFPCSVLFTFIYTQLSNRFNQEKIFHLMMGAFLLFFALFVFVIYPYKYWTSFIVFYAVCELWNTMMISILFWRFANQITPLTKAPRFYSILSLVISIAMMAAGSATALLMQNSWDQTMKLLISIIIFNGLLAMGLFHFANRGLEPASVIENKEKLTLRKCLHHVGQSKPLLCIAIIVVAYSLVINLVEVVWKDQLRTLYPHARDYNLYISYLQIGQGALAFICSISMALIIKWVGWTKTTLITPIIMMMCCLLFFGILLFQDHLQGIFFGITPLTAIVFIGALQNGISKGCKYSLFDSTKEMALLSLSSESQFKGKTVIDGIGVRFGKSGSSMIHQGLLIALTSVAATAPYVGGILLVAISLWIVAVCKLGSNQELQRL